MFDWAYFVVFLIFFLIVIGLIIALIYCDNQFKNKEGQLHQCLQDLANCEDSTQPGISLPVPIEAFKNQFGGQIGNATVFLTYDSSGKTVLTVDTNNTNIVQNPILLTTNSQPASTAQQWRLSFTSTNSVRISNHDGSLFWTVPEDPESDTPIVLNSQGSTFTIDSTISYLSFPDMDDSNFLLTANNSPAVKLSLISDSCMMSPYPPITLYVFGFNTGIIPIN